MLFQSETACRIFDITKSIHGHKEERIAGIRADLLFILFQKEKNTCLSNLLYIWYNKQKRKLGMYEFSCHIPAVSCNKLELL